MRLKVVLERAPSGNLVGGITGPLELEAFARKALECFGDVNNWTAAQMEGKEDPEFVDCLADQFSFDRIAQWERLTAQPMREGEEVVSGEVDAIFAACL